MSNEKSSVIEEFSASGAWTNFGKTGGVQLQPTFFSMLSNFQNVIKAAACSLWYTGDLQSHLLHLSSVNDLCYIFKRLLKCSILVLKIVSLRE